jgi:hypothetical protein
MRREERFSRSEIAIRQRPSAVWVVAIFIRAAGSLNHAIQRDMFDALELSHSELFSWALKEIGHRVVDEPATRVVDSVENSNFETSGPAKYDF